MRLHLVRHLQPTVGAGVCYGRSDLPVDPVLLERALPGLVASLPAAPVVASPLVRCAALATRLAPDARFDARLVELDFGAWEGRRWDDIERAEIDAWAADLAGYRPGGGESVTGMARRIAAFYDDLVREAAPDTIVVCHAGSIRLLAARHAGMAPDAMVQHAASHPHAIAYGEVIVLRGV